MVKENQCKNNIFRLHARNVRNVERNFGIKGGIDFSVTKFMFSKKSQLSPVMETLFLGLVINSVNMMLALLQKKVLNIQNKCLQRLVSPKTTIMELDRLLEKSSFTPQTMLPGRIATTTNSRGEGIKFLSNQNKIKSKVTGKVEVMEGEFTS